MPHLTFVLVCNLLAFAFSLAMYPFVIQAIRLGEKTNLATWISWLVMDIALLAAQYSQHAVSYQLAAYAAGTTAVLGFCVYRKVPMYWDITDTSCTVVVLVAAMIWWHTGRATDATIIYLSAMTVASYPMYKHFRRSKRIRLLPWVLNFIGAVFAVGAIKAFTVVDAAPAFTFLALSATFNFAVALTWRDEKIVSQVFMGD